MTSTLAPYSLNRHKEPDYRDAVERRIADQAVSGVVDLNAGFPALWADGGFRSLELQGETLSSMDADNYVVAGKEYLIEVVFPQAGLLKVVDGRRRGGRIVIARCSYRLVVVSITTIQDPTRF